MDGRAGGGWTGGRVGRRGQHGEGRARAGPPECYIQLSHASHLISNALVPHSISPSKSKLSCSSHFSSYSIPPRIPSRTHLTLQFTLKAATSDLLQRFAMKGVTTGVAEAQACGWASVVNVCKEYLCLNA